MEDLRLGLALDLEGESVRSFPAGDSTATRLHASGRAEGISAGRRHALAHEDSFQQDFLPGPLSFASEDYLECH